MRQGTTKGEKKMANNRKNVKAEIRTVWTNKITDWLKNAGEETLRVSSNEIAIPVVGSDGTEDFVIFTVKVPIGSRDGEQYDGYAMAKDYQMKQEEKSSKKALAEKQKEEKKARDAKAREARKQAREQKKKEEAEVTDEGAD